jgi:hypothetical protein
MSQPEYHPAPYDHVTTEMFDKALREVLAEMSVCQILAIPGVYESVCEELNNEVLDHIGPKEDHDD